MKRGPTCQRFIFRQSIYGYERIYGTGTVKIWKTRHKVSVDIRIVFTGLVVAAVISDGGGI